MADWRSSFQWGFCRCCFFIGILPCKGHEIMFWGQIYSSSSQLLPSVGENRYSSSPLSHIPCIQAWSPHGYLNEQAPLLSRSWSCPESQAGVIEIQLRDVPFLNLPMPDRLCSTCPFEHTVSSFILHGAVLNPGLFSGNNHICSSPHTHSSFTVLLSLLM